MFAQYLHMKLFIKVYKRFLILFPDVVDSSGLRLLYTPKLRDYDAGVMETGVWVSLYHMLPPGMQDYITEGHCTQECLQEVANEICLKILTQRKFLFMISTVSTNENNFDFLKINME